MLCMFFIIPSFVFGMGERQPQQNPIIGQIAPDFVLDTLYNGTKKLSDARDGKKAVLFFWATWCPHCHSQLMSLNNSIESLKRRGYAVVLVNLGEAAREVKAFMQFNTIFLDTFLDPDNSLQEAYNVIGVPTIYYLDENGVIVSEQHEFVSNLDKLFGAERKPQR